MTKRTRPAPAPRKLVGAREFLASGEGTMTVCPIGARIEALRAKRKLSREDLARRLGFGDARAVAAIESGAQSVTAGELVLVANKLGATLEYFTDPFLLAGEGEFSWLHDGASARTIAAFQGRAERWVAAYRALAPRRPRPAPSFRGAAALRGGLDRKTAARAGKRFVAEFDLDTASVDRMVDVMQRKLGILVLAVDMPARILAGACRLPGLDAVLVARNERADRLRFYLGYELFHVLTWEAAAPKPAERACGRGGAPASRFANIFAAAFAAPAGARETPCHRAPPAEGRSNVRTPAPLRGARPRGESKTAPAPFSKPFVETIGRAICEGCLSVRRAARLMETPVDDLAELFAAHGVEYAFGT